MPYLHYSSTYYSFTITMGGVPKKRHTKGSRNQRRMHLFLVKPNLTKCSKCGKPVAAHVVCPACGYYKGREVIDVMAKTNRKQRLAKAQEAKRDTKKPKEAAAKAAK
jgi:large subunit ribosomal protein L32